MKFDLVRLWRSNEIDEHALYHSHVQLRETGFTRTGGKQFASKSEMIKTMNGIMATQKRLRIFEEDLKIIETVGSIDFMDTNALDLTDQQAESLGWTK